MPELHEKLDKLAKIIDGQVITNLPGVTFCIKGIVSGFPVKIEATELFPFAISFHLGIDKFVRSGADNFNLSILPKYARGKLSAITRFLFFERKGQKLGLSKLDASFVFKVDNILPVKALFGHAKASEAMLALEQQTHFNEMVIKSDVGIYLSQPVTFKELEPEHCKTTFNSMAILAEYLC